MTDRTEIDIRPVTDENRAAVLALAVAPAQRGMIETTAQCLREAEEHEAWRPVALYAAGELVGFAMYGRFTNVWLDRLLIDARWQGRGYGEGALRALLARLKREYGRTDVYLSVFDGNDVASALYARYGFAANGERDWGGERVLVRRAQRAE